jgi:hypothetical protein
MTEENISSSRRNSKHCQFFLMFNDKFVGWINSLKIRHELAIILLEIIIS